MKATEARRFGEKLASLVEENNIGEANRLLAPFLRERTPFSALGRMGEILGKRSSLMVHPFLDTIAAGRSEGGWVIIGCALGQQLASDLEGSLARCRRYVSQGGAWYVADILGDRVPGPALLSHFDAALKLLDPWRVDKDRWVRRCVGIAVHFWAKRSGGAPELEARAGKLLGYLEPMFSEWEMDVVKGVGWGLKTLGKYYPELVAAWLSEQVERPHRALMVRKTMTYLPDDLQRTIKKQRST